MRYPRSSTLWQSNVVRAYWIVATTFFLSCESRHEKRRFELPVLRFDSRRSVGIWSATCPWLGSAETSRSCVSRSCVSRSCVSGSRTSASRPSSSCPFGSCVSSSPSFASYTCASLIIALKVAARSNLEMDRFEDALLGLGLPWSRSSWASADLTSSSCRRSCLAAAIIVSIY
jgi:hypothetical protein